MIESILKLLSLCGFLIILCTPPAIFAFLIFKIERIKWRFPPTERKTQFIFSYICLFYSLILAFPVWFILKVTEASLIGFWILILIITCSFFSLFRPVFTKGILASIFFYSCILYLEKSRLKRSLFIMTFATSFAKARTA